MNQRDVIVRCPGCGNGKVIALAVGQLLQCDVCGTNFQAPLTDDHDDSSATPETSFPADVGEQPHTAERGRPAAAVPATSNSAKTMKGSASPQPTRSWDMGLEEEIAGDASSEATGPPQEEGKRGTDEGGGLVWNLLAVLAAAVILITLCATVWLVIRRLPSSPQTASSLRHAAGDTASQEVTWTDASQYSQRRSPITVKVERVVYGALRAKDLSHQVITTEDDNLLGVTVSARNQGRRSRPFQNWYGHVFLDRAGNELLAELTDNQGRDYALLKFDDVSYIEGQRLADEIAPRESVQDTVVFLIPEEVNLATIDFFRVSLPGSAVGVGDFFRFQIPRSMIDGLQTPANGEADEAGPVRP